MYPDLIGSNSMGSIIGLLYAAGVPLDVMEDIFRSLEYSELFTLKIPVAGGFMDMRGLLAVLRELVGDVDIAELPIPVAVVCEDLRSMRQVVLCRGSVLEVMQAAVALPVWFEPARFEDLVLLDGGITNLTLMPPGRHFLRAGHGVLGGRVQRAVPGLLARRQVRFPGALPAAALRFRPAPAGSLAELPGFGADRARRGRAVLPGRSLEDRAGVGPAHVRRFTAWRGS